MFTGPLSPAGMNILREQIAWLSYYPLRLQCPEYRTPSTNTCEGKNEIEEKGEVTSAPRTVREGAEFWGLNGRRELRPGDRRKSGPCRIRKLFGASPRTHIFLQKRPLMSIRCKEGSGGTEMELMFIKSLFPKDALINEPRATHTHFCHSPE